MGQAQVKTAPRRSKRLRIIEPAPKPPVWNGEADALEKVGGELGLVLWKALRRVRLWSETEPERRKDLFLPVTAEVRALMAAAGVQAPELIEAVGVFTALLRAPERADGKQLAEACNQVYQWADAQGLFSVAMYFSEAAAAAEPTNPTWAIDAGWMCRRVAGNELVERSAAWYDRAFGLAVRARDRQEVIRSLTEYGALMKHMGRYEKARVLYERAAIRAARTGRLRQAAVAHHYLLGLVAETGMYDRGERYARLALENYPIHDPQLPALAHDWAFLLVRRQLFSVALPLLDMTVGQIQRPTIQTVVWGTLARAAAGSGRQDRYDEAKRKVLQLIQSHQEYAPSALNGLAEGAWTFNDWYQAEQFATQAQEIARIRQDASEERVATRLLEQITERRLAPAELTLPDRERGEMLTRRFLARLRSWKAPSQNRPGAIISEVKGSFAGGSA